MTIYTSNYARKGSDPNAVGISVGLPKWFKGRSLGILAPTWDMVNGSHAGAITHDEYTEQYIALLESRKINLEKLLNGLPDPTYLLCYEPPGDFCHRRLFAEWAELKCGWVIPEWKNPKEMEIQRQSEVVDDLFDF